MAKKDSNLSPSVSKAFAANCHCSNGVWLDQREKGPDIGQAARRPGLGCEEEVTRLLPKDGGG